MNEAAIYKALGDPVRLKIVNRLSTGSPCTISDLSGNLGMSRQGARKQLQVLVQAKVVRLAQHGRETHVTLDTKALETARIFIARLESQWDERLVALKRVAES